MERINRYNIKVYNTMFIDPQCMINSIIINNTFRARFIDYYQFGIRIKVVWKK